MEENQQNPAPVRVSAIIVSSNNAAALRRSLAALEASHGRETLEVIVVDSGSADDSSRVDAEFPAIQLLRLPRNFGLVKALNIGMRTAKGEFFLFLEPGMEVAPDTVPSLAARLEAAPDAVAVCPMITGPAGETLSRTRPLPLPAELYRAWCDGGLEGWSTPPAGVETLEVDCVSPPVLMARGYFLRGLRYIDERYGQYGWDLELCTQIHRSAKKILFIPGVRVTRRTEERAAPLGASARGLLGADQALGAAVWTTKHYGWFHGLKFRLATTLRALVRLLGMRDAGYRFALASALVSGQKIDGSQQAL
jgi:GT2 family glycosyltransferase